MSDNVIAAGILAAVVICWLAFHLLSKPQGRVENPGSGEPAYPHAPVDKKPLRGILTGILSGLAIGILTLLGPALINLDFGLVWLWFSWGIAPIAALIGGTIVHRVVRRRAEAAEREEKSQLNLRDL